MSLLDWQFFCDSFVIEKGGLESTFFHLFLTQEQLAMCGVGIAGEGSISPNTPEGKWRKSKNKKEVLPNIKQFYKRVRKWAVIQSTVDLLAHREQYNIKKERKVVN